MPAIRNSAAIVIEATPRAILSLHEPTHPRPLPGGEQAIVHAAKIPLLGGVRGGFMVPVPAPKRKEALHEPQFLNPNDESRNPKEYRNPNEETDDRTPERASSFELGISFVIWNLSFVIP